MRGLRSLLLLVLLPFATFACRDGGLGVPGDGDPDMARGDLGGNPGDPCAAYTTRASCEADARCEAIGCPLCEGGATFDGCWKTGSGPDILCPAIACQEGCGFYGDQKSCDADPGCTSTYRDAGVCDCSEPGCCMMFDRCVDQPVSCSPPAVGPGCPDPSIPVECGKAYAPIFSHDGCQIGCVRLDVCVDDADCRVSGCAVGYECQLCWTTYECMMGGNAC